MRVGKGARFAHLACPMGLQGTGAAARHRIKRGAPRVHPRTCAPTHPPTRTSMPPADHLPCASRRRWAERVLAWSAAGLAPGLGLWGCAAGRTPAPSARANPATALLPWAALAPPNWHALQPLWALGLRSLDGLDDTEPAHAALWRRLRMHWDSAPTVPALHGQRVQLAGFIQPLAVAGASAGAGEALLVASFGACTQTPAPPANQVLRLRLDRGADRVVWGSTGAVLASGVLLQQAADSPLGRSAWYLDRAELIAYQSDQWPGA